MKPLTHFTKKNWDSDFFETSIFFADLTFDLSDQDIADLRDDIDQLDDIGCKLAEVRVRSSHFQNVPILENFGFRLVDSRLEFRTLTTRSDFDISVPLGTLRWYQNTDWREVTELTESQFAMNQAFRSRYNSREYFSFNQSNRYYTQWNRRAIDCPNPLFCIWEVDGQVAGFYAIIRQLTKDVHPEYKVGLAAVRPSLAKYGMANKMQYWIFKNAPDQEFTVVNSPALTNIAGLKNNIRALKELSHVEAFFFRRPN